ncbi:hemerythrin HHE cation binding domain-containing protein [Mycolicibacterium mageritense DSM 44476 = CIP 104973]|uniref:Hemerythrin n=1 Tax=Mycolicibacterium mageritense TaxID=53462 RepID=A0ABM7HZQ7_MYCME|nr:hemerythrin domain-containing protein [Mycolicibacterium mageritense]MBN3453623.1 hemerythrin domain-containing protein [Mycobacterium sp. DSM 3803]MCC9183668.1 hemerythrin domain-containing protein [Mycolicibacterium mageritense]CDO24200.1 hemerythrin HHE cation binding domain-containing protein [Mycolicibacterium mageritense DSM 44476 = CIP 104973]BBX36082.1 hemerythrin [Mycolicibacterium mageritense]GJJ17225.1 hemerythrin [Mycolicibacterium mageritense]
MTTSDTQDLVDRIIADHREVEAVFKEIEGCGTPAKRHELVEHAIAELVRHSIGEEEYLYPAARKALPAGDDLANRKLREHTDAEWVMKRIEGLHADDTQFESLITKLIDDVRQHFESEEREVLPGLRTACSDTELRALGEKFEHSKRSAPTRPHPSAPNRAPFNKILAPGEGLIDRLRDAMTGRKV